ncbi:MAG: hypothetical protein ABJB01_08625 [Rudaea sp.]
MRKYMHWWITLLFLLALAYDVVVWGAAAGLPEIGDKLQKTAHREALLANVYMSIGMPLVAAVPFLDTWGENYVRTAISEGFPRIEEDPAVAFDLIFTQSWNATHRTLKTMYWIPPLLAVSAIFFWARRPKKIRLMGRR